MCYHSHAQHFRPEPLRAPRSLRRRVFFRRMVGLATLAAALAFTAFAIAMVIARMHNTEAQLDAVHLQGLQLGMSMCPSRGGR